MEKTLHILRNAPEDVVAQLIEAMAAPGGVTVSCLYEDDVSPTPVNWPRLVEDIFQHDKVICWW
jgi:hypothetical protein